MNEEHRNALQASQHDICQDLEAENVLPYLNTKGIVQDGQVEEIMTTTRRDMRIMRIIHILKGAGPLAFHEFINALQISNKNYLAETILAHLPSSSTQQLTLPEMNTIQAPSTPLSTSSQSNTIDWEKMIETTRQLLKNKYKQVFQHVYPFSLPFTFDIKNAWVSLALKEDEKNSLLTEDHAKLLENAFNQAKMLIIEGDPATGKTSLMRRLAYEWAEGQEGYLSEYELVLYAEFREVREREDSIVTLALEHYLADEKFSNMKECMKDFCAGSRILILLDGYDESPQDKQCSELSKYLFDVKSEELPFHVIITTRKGPLSALRGLKGRFVFTDVLGFATKQQKEKYVMNHFLSTEIDNKRNIATVHSLLAKNENLNKLAETPLFLTFICLVHERVIDGTLVELYCNILRWLIDRHQKDFPDRDIPALFEFQSASAQASEPLNMREKQNTIRSNYLQFPQLNSLGKMALNKLEMDIFQETNLIEFNIGSIIHQVGLIRKDEFYDQTWNLTSTYSFPHRTIQEFLAAFYCFCLNDATYEWLLPNSKLDTSEIGMSEFERFLLRIALSNNMPINIDKRKYYFERIADIYLNITFDAFNTTAGFNNKLLNWFLSQCNNVQRLTLNGELKNGGYARDMLNDTSIPNESVVASRMFILPLLSFDNLMKLGSLTFENCIFEANFQLSFTNCSFLKNLQFSRCEIKYGTNLNIATLSAIETVEFWQCIIELATWQSITNAIKNSSINYLKLTFEKSFNQTFLDHLKECSNVEKMEITICDNKICQKGLLSFNDLMKLQSVSFAICTFEANSQLLFKNCSSLKILNFTKCGIYNSTKLDISTLSAIETVKFCRCSLEAYSQLSLTNCTSLKNLEFSTCEIKSSPIDGITRLPAIDTVEFYKCKIYLSVWKIITDQIRSSPIKCLKLSADYFVKEIYPEFLHHLHKCDRINEIHVKDTWNSNINDNILNRYEEEVTANLALTAQKLLGLRSITIEFDKLNECRRLQERNKERIEKAGQERNVDFSIKYVE